METDGRVLPLCSKTAFMLFLDASKKVASWCYHMVFPVVQKGQQCHHRSINQLSR